MAVELPLKGLAGRQSAPSGGNPVVSTACGVTSPCDHAALAATAHNAAANRPRVARHALPSCAGLRVAGMASTGDFFMGVSVLLKSPHKAQTPCHAIVLQAGTLIAY